MITNPSFKYCPKCAAQFECRANDIQNCQCNNIEFSTTEKEYIGTLYIDCLCRDCLLKLKQERNIGVDKSGES